MDPPQECSLEDASYQSLGIGELTEKVQDKKLAKISVIVKGRDDHGQKIRSESEQGATTEVCYTGAGALGPWNQKGGGDEKPRLQQLKEPGHEAAEGSQSGDTNQSDFCNKFSQLQLQELDRVFQRTQYPDVFARKELAIPLSVTEGKAEPNKSEKPNLPEKPF
ncbi:rhox homeobox family member 2 isoform X2 [Ictidomys tridecemlineatus]|uniref:homeobox protein ESX1-like isoform X2 n=1 Tax=Ictidomys tridecemlineatus TaxID=43179 RepID=UPI00038BED8C|nr:homeobox protein ESX1-like isoform X2 [Ictidomys tridecemlineatus]KAG3272827.1 homeobox protein ESX1-like, transcript variant X2 [Ictidomys tridecemlineatus]